MEQGIVSSVKYNDGIVLCDVKPIRFNTNYSNVPVIRPHSGFIQVPSQGDTVMMSKLDDNTRFIVSLIEEESAYPASVKEGDLAIQVDENTKIQIGKQDDGTYNITISSSNDLKLQSEGSISIEASKRIDLDATDGVYINGTKFGDHTHYYEWSDAGGSDDTDPPN